MNRFLIALLSASLVAGAAVANPDATEPLTKRSAASEWSNDGLRPVRVKGLDLVYVRPGAPLSTYRKVMINPVSVAFRRDWQRNAAEFHGSRIRPEDIQEIKDDIGRVVRAEVVRELSTAGYELVDQPGAGVLQIDVRVAELYLNAPDLPSAGINRTYTMSFGEMNLVADLRDSTTGNSVMRVLDRTMGRDLGVLRLTTRVENAADVRVAASTWARALRRELDLAKGARG
jgi:hypothetical protein